MKLIGNITLSGGPGADGPDRSFIHQTLEIRAETRTSRLELDGKLSVARCPGKVTWYGGSPSFFTGVTHIRIVSNGMLLIDVAVDSRQPPSLVSGGVSFEVTESE
jgi:hypothetical protein